jgi:hypothetical protein
MMKKIIFILLITASWLSHVSAQVAVDGDASCSFLKDLKFKNGVDTIQVTAVVRAVIQGNEEPKLRILADKNELDEKEYLDEHFDSEALNFIPEGCTNRFTGTLTRKLYDKTFVRKTKDLGAYMKEVVDLDALQRGQKINLKCLVFEDQKTRNRLGNYFFTIIDLNASEK